jgi:hypothetical protein
MTRATDARLRLLAFGIAFVALAAALVVSFAVTPEDIESGRVVLTPACPTKYFFGFECASCGMTRAFTALGHGRLGDALAYNRGAPLVWGAFWVAAALALRSLTRAARDWRAATR